MKSYYMTCWVEGMGVVRCGHHHETIWEAEECHREIVSRFFRVVEGENERSINDEEFEAWRRLAKRLLLSP